MDLVEGDFTDHDYPSSVLERIKLLWLSKKLCDATLEAGPVKIYVHRLILHAAIPGLTHLQMCSTEKHLEVIFPTEIKADALNAVVDYLYTGELHLTPQNVSWVAQVSHLLGLENLYRFCNQYQWALGQKGIVTATCECFENPVIVLSQSETATQVHYLESKDQIDCFQRQHGIMDLPSDVRTVNVAKHEGFEIDGRANESNIHNSELALKHSDFTQGTFGQSPCKDTMLFHIKSERSSSGTTSSQQRSSPDTSAPVQALSSNNESIVGLDTVNTQKFEKLPEINVPKIPDYPSSEDVVTRAKPQIVERSIKLETLSDDEVETDRRRINAEQGGLQWNFINKSTTSTENLNLKNGNQKAGTFPGYISNLLARYFAEESKSTVKVSRSPSKLTEVGVVDNSRNQRQLTCSDLEDQLSEEYKNTMLENERMMETMCTLRGNDKEINSEEMADHHRPSDGGHCREFSSPPLNCMSRSSEFQSQNQLEGNDSNAPLGLCSGTSSLGTTTSNKSVVDEGPWSNPQSNSQWPVEPANVGVESEEFAAFCPLCLINFLSRAAYTAHLNICFNTFHHMQQNKFIQREWTRQLKSAVSRVSIQSSTSGRIFSFVRSNPLYSTSTSSTDVRPIVHSGINRDTMGPTPLIKDVNVLATRHGENGQDKIRSRNTIAKNMQFSDEFPVGYTQNGSVQPYCTSKELQPYCTSKELQPHCTSKELQPHCTSKELQPHCTSKELQPHCTSKELQPHCTSKELGERNSADDDRDHTQAGERNSADDHRDHTQADRVGGETPEQELGIRITNVWTLKDSQEEMELPVNPENREARECHDEEVERHAELSTMKEKSVESHMKERSPFKVTAKGNKLYIKRKHMDDQSQDGKGETRTPSKSKEDATMDKNPQTCLKSKKMSRKRRKRKLFDPATKRKLDKRRTRTQITETVMRDPDGAPDPKSVGVIGCVTPVDGIVNSAKEASEMVITQTPIKKLTDIVEAVVEREYNFFLKRKRANAFGHTVYDVDAPSSGKQIRRSARKSNTVSRQQGDQLAKRKVYRFINPEGRGVSSPVAHQSPGLTDPTPIHATALAGSLPKSPMMSLCAPSLLNGAGNVTRSPQTPLSAPTAMESDNVIQIPAQQPQLTTIYTHPCNLKPIPDLSICSPTMRRSTIAEKIANVYRKNCLIIPKEGKEWTHWTDFPKPKQTDASFQYTMPLKKRKYE